MMDQQYMQRAFDLARLAMGRTSPNPIVGALLVHQNRIIGEGYHQQYGGPHAEVNAVNSVSAADKHLLSVSTLYVSLEPCSVYGKTPPCTDLIIRERIPRVVLSYLDHSPEVDGSGVARLRAAGIEVTVNVLAEEGKRISATRNIFVMKHRPYVILKYAQSQDGFLGPGRKKALWMTNGYSKRLVHKWRSEVDSILVGTNTAAWDNPQLTNRLYFGPSPLRLVLDRYGRLPAGLHLFDGSVPTWVFMAREPPFIEAPGLRYINIAPTEGVVPQILRELRQENKTSLMVEGGTALLQSFIDQELWDEARVFIAPVVLGKGVPAPTLPAIPQQDNYRLGQDRLIHIRRELSFREM